MKTTSLYQEKINQQVATALIGERNIRRANYKKHGGREAYLKHRDAEISAMPDRRFIDEAVRIIDGKAKKVFVLRSKKRPQQTGGKVGEFDSIEAANKAADELGLA